MHSSPRLRHALPFDMTLDLLLLLLVSSGASSLVDLFPLAGKCPAGPQETFTVALLNGSTRQADASRIKIGDPEPKSRHRLKRPT